MSKLFDLAKVSGKLTEGNHQKGSYSDYKEDPAGL